MTAEMNALNVWNSLFTAIKMAGSLRRAHPPVLWHVPPSVEQRAYLPVSSQSLRLSLVYAQILN